mgnify:CR=1 FL=1
MQSPDLSPKTPESGPSETLCLPGGAQAVPSGAALAALATQAWRAGSSVDAALALPRYVRDKVAQTTAERAAAVQA